MSTVFNDKDFSDRILHVEIVADSLHSKSDSVGSDDDCDVDPTSKNVNKKQKRENFKDKGDAAYEHNSKCSTTDVKLKTYYICSAILATSSPFFYKLFKNGMRESQERIVTLRINTSEEAALMDLLNFMYSNTLRATSAPDLVGVLMVADKFEVSSCMRYCSKRLKKMTMTLESILLYLELPSSVEVLQPLIDAAKKALVRRFASVLCHPTLEKQSMSLPLYAIEVLLSSPDLEVPAEEDVYAFILKWGRAHYPKQEERQEILTKLAEQFLYFPYLNMSTLREIQDSPDFDTKQVSKLMMESLYLSAGFPYGERNCLHVATTNNRRMKRNYYKLPIKEVEVESSRHVVYLNLTKEECRKLNFRDALFSQTFFLGGQAMLLVAKGGRNVVEEDNYLSVYVERREECDRSSDGTRTFDYELEVMEEEEEFKRVYKLHNCTLTVEDDAVGLDNTFGIPWSDFMADDSPYFIDGILHLRAQFTIKNN